MDTFSNTYILIVSVLLCGAVYADCPDGWIVYDGSCYYFSHNNVSFVEATHFCEFHGSHLVHINTAAENAFLKSFTSDLNSHLYWLGMSDKDTEGVWKWTDTDTVITFTDWFGKEPVGGRIENCALLTEQNGWEDYPCTLQFEPICEKNMSESTSCKDGQVSFGDSCYLFSHENLHYAEAENYCRQHKSHLVHVETALENTFIRSFLQGLKNANHWLGLTDEIIEDIWKWYDTDTMVEYTDWAPGQPDGGRLEDCACYWAAVDFHWVDAPCSTRTYQPICETKKENSLEIIG